MGVPVEGVGKSKRADAEVDDTQAASSPGPEHAAPGPLTRRRRDETTRRHYASSMSRPGVLLLVPLLAGACSGASTRAADDGGASIPADAAADTASDTLPDALFSVEDAPVDADSAPPACAAGWLRCGGTCIDPQSDAANCGACEVTCPAASSCAAGRCASGPSCAGAACVTTSAACAGSTTEAVFVAESVPTGPLATGIAVDVSVTFANCGARTWTAAAAGATTGFKLGAQAPQDNATWGMGRVALPADVPPNGAVRVPFTIQAPTTPGAYAFSWEILNEGVAWIPAASPVTTFEVTAPANDVTLCPGVTADASGGSGAAGAIQQCIDATPSGGTLALPAGSYRIDAQLQLARPITLTTAGLATSTGTCLDAGVSCAMLQAAPDLDVANGMLAVSATDHVAIDHLVLDGNRSARLGGAAAAKCAAGNNRNGFNAMNGGGADSSFTYSASIHALCGTGFEWRGDRATITHSVFRDNGENAVKNMWSDGLTLLQSDGANVSGNRFENNSDVSFICGGARAATFKDNRLTQSTQVSFAGFMMDNFNGGTSGDFTGTTASGFVVDCTSLLCHFGIEIGPHPWYLSANTIGGTVTGMTVTGARQGLNVEGGGTSAAPVRVFGNDVTGSPTSATFNCGTRSTSNLNFSPDSFVDRAGDTTPATNVTWHGCP